MEQEPVPSMERVMEAKRWRILTAREYGLSSAGNGKLLGVLHGECSEQMCSWLAMCQTVMCQLDALSRCRETPGVVLALLAGA